jgi:hypothetical protein
VKKVILMCVALLGIFASTSSFAQFNPSNGFQTINNQCGTYFLQNGTYYNYQGVSIGSSIPVCGGSMSLQQSNSVLITGGSIVLTQYATANLPTCNSAIKGQLLEVTDATSPTYNGTLTGGGGVIVPVICNGTAWLTH